MVGKSKKLPGSRPYINYSNDALVQAVQDCKKGLSYRRVAEKYGISKSTLQRRVENKHYQSVGRPTVLSEDDEHNLREGIITACKWGFPLKGIDIRCIVKAYLDKKGIKEKRFQNNYPGLDWFKGFMYRHRKYLSERMAENIKRSRAAICTSTITKYFEELKISLEGISPDCIVNYDEINITDDPVQEKIVTRRSCRHPKRMIDSSKSSVSVMFGGTASGYLLPPYIVYKAEYLYNTWTENGPKEARYNRSKSGWFDGRIFEDWFLFTVLPYFKKQGPKPKAIIGDNLASHLSLNVISECEKNNIKFILLPPNSTHLCQPLDVVFFRPLKRSWRESLTKWKAKNCGRIPKTEFPKILKKTLDKLGENNTSSQNLVSGFKASGIFPLDPNKVLQKLPDFQIVNDTSINNSETSWVQSFEEFLSDNRMKETHTERKMRKKKIDFIPGSCVTSINEDIPDKPEPMNQPSTSRGIFSDYSVDDSEEDQNILSSTLDEDEENVVYSNVVKKAKSEISLSVFEENDFVTVKLLYNEGTPKQNYKYFYAQVINVIEQNNPTKLKVKFLKIADSINFIYVFPYVSDEKLISVNQVENIVFPVALKRNRFKFPTVI